jgi:hypothetical protein
MTNTTYDSRRIQQERRQIDKPSQEKCNAQESRKGKNGKILKNKKWWQGREKQIMKQHWLAFEINAHTDFPDWSNAAPCDKCGKCFITASNKANRFCSIKCFQLFQIDRWFNCSKCHASLGLTTKQSGVILRISRTSIGKQWGNHGIKTKKPHTQGWQAMNRASLKSQISIFHKEWMIDVRSNVKFPDWSYLWIKEKSRRISNERYHKMSFAEKKEFNNKSQALRMARHGDNPSIARRYQDRRNAWKKRNPEKVRASVRLSLKKRKLIDPGFRVQCNLRSRLKELIGTAKRGGSSQINNLTGCSTQQLAKHLESQFKHGMSWDNYGVDGWHVDHIIPCASFDHTDHKQIKHCWHWTNLRPLWAKDNISKSDTITEPQLNLLLCSHH